MTTPYQPRSNEVERFHRTLSNYLKTVIDENKEVWPDLIPFAVFTNNNTYNTSTGFAPFEIVFGRSFELPSSVFTPTYNYDTYVSAVKENLKKCTLIAKENITKRKEYNQRQYNSKNPLNDIKVKVGDSILVLKQGQKHKLDKNYIGPFVVHSFVEPTTVIYKRGNRFVKIHKDKIKIAEAEHNK